MVCGVTREYIATTFTFAMVMVLPRQRLLEVIQTGCYDSIKAAIYTRARWQRVKQSFMALSRTLGVLRQVSGGDGSRTSHNSRGPGQVVAGLCARSNDYVCL